MNIAKQTQNELKHDRVETAIEVEIGQTSLNRPLFENKGENVFENKGIFWDFETQSGTISQDKITVNNGRRCLSDYEFDYYWQNEVNMREKGPKYKIPVRTEETIEHNKWCDGNRSC